eukprot:Gb_10166 [translate_table: standard]
MLAPCSTFTSSLNWRPTMYVSSKPRNKSLPILFKNVLS